MNIVTPLDLGMEIIYGYPPNIEEIKKHFSLSDSVVFTYGNKLYNPHKGHVDEHLMKHEETHARQQGDDPAAWWKKYLSDPEFRLQQEAEAYGRQYRSFAVHHDRNKVFFFLHGIAYDLSSGIYGNIISLEEAKKLIKK